METIQSENQLPGLADGRLLARNTLVNLVGQVIPRLVGLGAIPIIVRGLGTDGYGILSLALLVLGYFSLFDLGLGLATTKFVAAYLGQNRVEEVPRLVWTSLVMQLLVGVLGGLGLAASAPLLVSRVLHIPPALVGEAKTTFLLLAVSVPLVLGAATLQGVLSATQRFDLVNAVLIPMHSSNFVVPAVGAWLGFGLPGIVVVLVFVRLAAAVANLMLCFKVFPSLRCRPRLEFKLLRALAAYGSWVSVTNLLQPLLLYADRFMIGALLSMAAVAYYAASFQLAFAFGVLPVSLLTTLFPAFSAAGAAGDRKVIEKLYARAVKALLLVEGPLVLLVVFLARGILRLWLGARFAEQGTASLQVLAVGLLIGSLAYVSFTLLQALGRPDLPAKFYLLELPLYAGALWFLVGKMGIAGAALAWTLRMVLDATLSLAACSALKVVPLRALAQDGLWRSVIAFASLAVTLWLAFLAGGGILVQGFLAGLVMVLFAGTVWRYGLDAADKSFLTSLASRLAATVTGQV